MIRKKEKQLGPLIVDLTGPDGNAFALISLANKLSKKFNIKSPVDEMQKGDYEHLLQVFDQAFGDFVILER
jgi:hypothetical protein|tara:strand:- start:1173 stop:1385 length:213 start_codon:yes stop_codon:yes gene_type:complete